MILHHAYFSAFLNVLRSRFDFFFLFPFPRGLLITSRFFFRLIQTVILHVPFIPPFVPSISTYRNAGFARWIVLTVITRKMNQTRAIIMIAVKICCFSPHRTCSCDCTSVRDNRKTLAFTEEIPLTNERKTRNIIFSHCGPRPTRESFAFDTWIW